jgi:hypothetical protein
VPASPPRWGAPMVWAHTFMRAACACSAVVAMPFGNSLPGCRLCWHSQGLCVLCASVLWAVSRQDTLSCSIHPSPHVLGKPSFGRCRCLLHNFLQPWLEDCTFPCRSAALADGLMLGLLSKGGVGWVGPRTTARVLSGCFWEAKGPVQPVQGAAIVLL